MIYAELNEELVYERGTYHLDNYTSGILNGIEYGISVDSPNKVYLFNICDTENYGSKSSLRERIFAIRDIVSSVGASRVIFPILNYKLDGVCIKDVRMILLEAFFNKDVYIKVVKSKRGVI